MTVPTAPTSVPLPWGGLLAQGRNANAQAPLEENLEVLRESLHSLSRLASEQGAEGQQRFFGNQIEVVEVVIQSRPQFVGRIEREGAVAAGAPEFVAQCGGRTEH